MNWEIVLDFLDFIVSTEGVYYLYIFTGIGFLSLLYISPNFQHINVNEERRAKAFYQEINGEDVKVLDTSKKEKTTFPSNQVDSKEVVDENEESDTTPTFPTIPRETCTINTDVGPLQITIVGRATSRANIFTFHDIGMNHRDCFNTFFQCVSRKPPFSSFCIYHIDFPGQQENADDLNDKIHLDFEKLANVIDLVCQKFQVLSFIGIGAGIGGNVLLRYASNYASKVQGNLKNEIMELLENNLKVSYVKAMILLGVTRSSPDFNESRLLASIRMSLNYFGMNSWVKSSLSGYMFSDAAASRQKYLVNSYHRALDQLNVVNLMKLLEATQNRSELTKERLSSLSGTPIIIITGGQASSGLPFMQLGSPEATALDLLNQFNRQKASWLKISSSGHHVIEERPAGDDVQLCIFSNLI